MLDSLGLLTLEVVGAIDGQLGASVRRVKRLPVAILGRRLLHRKKVRRILGRGSESRIRVGVPLLLRECCSAPEA